MDTFLGLKASRKREKIYILGLGPLKALIRPWLPPPLLSRYMQGSICRQGHRGLTPAGKSSTPPERRSSKSSAGVMPLFCYLLSIV